MGENEEHLSGIPTEKQNLEASIKAHQTLRDTLGLNGNVKIKLHTELEIIFIIS